MQRGGYWMKHLLKRLFSKTVNDIEIRMLPSKRQIFIKSVDEISNILTDYREQNIYFGVYTRSGGGSKEHVKEASCLFADLDFKGYKRGEEEAKEMLKAFPLEPSVLVESGNGYHAYWILEPPIDAQTHCDEIESILKGIAFKLLSDPNVAEIARILRVPGSFNHKCIPPKEVKVIQASDKTYNLEAFTAFKTQQSPIPKVTAQQKETIESLCSRCGFIKYAVENAATLPEPLWYPMISNVARLVGGPSLCHDISKGYPKYNRREVDQKILHAMNASGPFACQTIKDLMSDNLGFDCGFSCGVKSPVLKLRSGTKTDKENKKEIIDECELIDATDLVRDTLAYIEKRHKTKGQLSGISTGFQRLDWITDGWQPGNLITLAARPSVGKSALMLQMSRAGVKQAPVGIVSLEMGKIEKGLRYMARDTMIPIDNFRKGLIKQSDFSVIMSAVAEFAELPLYFGYSAYSDVAMSKMVNRMVTEKGCRLIFIDHLQLMHSAESIQNRSLELGRITKELKRQTVRYSISIVLLCQLNREVEKVARAPKMSDLRDSGAIEQDSDVIIMLHVVETGNVQAHIVKGRNIGTSMFEMEYRGELTAFKEIIREDGKDEDSV